jgi:hypothetical protein
MTPTYFIKTQRLIHSLTNDEDLRQELWLLVLSGCPLTELKERLVLITLQGKVLEVVPTTIQSLMISTNKSINDILHFISPPERSIVMLAAAGLTDSQILLYKGISRIRLQQLMTTIRRSRYWDGLLKDLQNAKEEIDP